MTQQKRIINEIYFIRAIACLLVVLVHVTGGKYDIENGFPSYFLLTLNQFSRLGTPIFAVISAFLLFYSVQKKGFHFKKFVLSRTTKILFPFFLWSFLYLVFQQYYLGHNVLFVDWKDYIFSYLLLGTASYHLYFMSVVFQFYFIFPVVQMIRKGKLIFILFLLSLPLNYFSLNIDNFGILAEGSKLYTILTLRPFILNWISYFLFGALLAHYFEEIRKFIKNNTLLVTTLFCLIIVGMYYELNPDQLYSSSRPANLIYIPVFILFLLKIHPSIIKNSFTFHIFDLIGRYSMGIYLAHPLVLFILPSFLPGVFWTTNLIILTFLLTISISMLLVRLITTLPMASFIIPLPPSNKNVKSDLKLPPKKKVSASNL